MSDENDVIMPDPAEGPAQEVPVDAPLPEPLDAPVEPAVPEIPAPPAPPAYSAPTAAPPAPPAPPIPAPAAPPAPPEYSAPPAPPAYSAPTAAPATSLPEQEKQKVVAGVLAILLGSLGIHKFYLGYKTEGIIMLAATILLSWTGVVPGVLGLVGVIEGIIYLTKTDQDFYQTYVAGRKPWF